MSKYKFSWQGIGISSDPKIKRDPISQHMLAYLKYGSESSENHLVAVGDTPQINNYISLYDINEKEANKIALRKGRRKAKDIEKICFAHNLENIEVKNFEEINGTEEIKGNLLRLFKVNNNLRNEFYSLIPNRIKEKANASDLEKLSQYSIDEISMALSIGGTRISHPKQKEVDSLTQKIQEEYRIGNPISFDYPENLGLEYVPGSDLEVEPYSAINPKRRILLTDSKRKFKEKISNLKDNEKEIIVTQIKSSLGTDPIENPTEFYNKIISPPYDQIKPLHSILNKLALFTTAFALAPAMSGNTKYSEKMGNDYQKMEFGDFIEKYSKDILGFSF